MTAIRFLCFFQAEDGIRDPLVTGVQTGALPISAPRQPPGEVALPLLPGPLAEQRSEERRVGKECRSRWSPYHSKKKQRNDNVPTRSFLKILFSSAALMDMIL